MYNESFLYLWNMPEFSKSVKEITDEARISGYFNTITAYEQSIIPKE